MKKRKTNESLQHTLNVLFVAGILVINVMLFVFKENLIFITAKIKCNNQLIGKKQDAHERTYGMRPFHKN